MTDNILYHLAQCNAATNHLITNAVFNISSDIMMLCIPLPLLITSRLPRTKYAQRIPNVQVGQSSY